MDNIFDFKNICKAFSELDAKFCERGSKFKYFHIHGPKDKNAELEGKHGSHYMVIERHSGAISFNKKFLGNKFQARERPHVRISEHPLGGSTGTNFGNFDKGLTLEDISLRWKTPQEFANEVVSKIKSLNLQW